MEHFIKCHGRYNRIVFQGGKGHSWIETCQDCMWKILRCGLKYDGGAILNYGNEACHTGYPNNMLSNVGDTLYNIVE